MEGPIDARIDRAKGVWVKALLPRPVPGSWAESVWNAARQGLLRAWSVGGRWMREAAAGYNRTVGADLAAAGPAGHSRASRRQVDVDEFRRASFQDR